MEIQAKACLICKQIKELDLFYRDYSRKDKRNPRCKECWREYMKEPHRLEAKERYVEQYKLNPHWVTRNKEYQRRYREKKKLEKLERLG